MHISVFIWGIFAICSSSISENSTFVPFICPVQVSLKCAFLLVVQTHSQYSSSVDCCCSPEKLSRSCRGPSAQLKASSRVVEEITAHVPFTITIQNMSKAFWSIKMKIKTCNKCLRQVQEFSPSMLISVEAKVLCILPTAKKFPKKQQPWKSPDVFGCSLSTVTKVGFVFCVLYFIYLPPAMIGHHMAGCISGEGPAGRTPFCCRSFTTSSAVGATHLNRHSSNKRRNSPYSFLLLLIARSTITTPFSIDCKPLSLPAVVRGNVWTPTGMEWHENNSSSSGLHLMYVRML